MNKTAIRHLNQETSDNCITLSYRTFAVLQGMLKVTDLTVDASTRDDFHTVVLALMRFSNLSEIFLCIFAIFNVNGWEQIVGGGGGWGWGRGKVM